MGSLVFKDIEVCLYQSNGMQSFLDLTSILDGS